MKLEREFQARERLKVELANGHLTVRVDPLRTTVQVTVEIVASDRIRADITGTTYGNETSVGLHIEEIPSSTQGTQGTPGGDPYRVEAPSKKSRISSMLDTIFGRDQNQNVSIHVGGDVIIGNKVIINGVNVSGSVPQVTSIKMIIKTPSLDHLSIRGSNLSVLFVSDGKGGSDLNTCNGHLEIRNGGTPLRASTTNGRITAEVGGRGYVDLSSTNGAILASFPQDWKGAVRASTVNGKVRSQSFEETGSAVALISTVNGKITIERRS